MRNTFTGAGENNCDINFFRSKKHKIHMKNVFEQQENLPQPSMYAREEGPCYKTNPIGHGQTDEN